VILALGKPILWLFGPQFVDGYFLMFILAIGPLARATVGPGRAALNMVGEQRACAVVYASAFATTSRLRGADPAVRRRGRGDRDLRRDDLEAVLLYAVAKQRLGLHVFIWRPQSHERNEPAAPRRSRWRASAPMRPGRGRPRRRMEAADALRATRWRDLVARALEPNVFYDPAFALAAAPCSATGRRRRGVVEGRPPDRAVSARIERRYGVMATLTGWTHPMRRSACRWRSRRGGGDRGVSRLIETAREEALMLPLIAREAVRGGAVARAGAARRRDRAIRRTCARAAGAGGAARLSRSHREQEAEGAAPPAPPARDRRARSRPRASGRSRRLVGSLHALEAAGWKGRAGSAARRIAAIRTSCRGRHGAGAEGGARIDRLIQDGRRWPRPSRCARRTALAVEDRL
jgi:hypothetical protein